MPEAEKTIEKKNKTAEKMKMMKEGRCTRKTWRCMKEKKWNKKRESRKTRKKS